MTIVVFVFFLLSLLLRVSACGWQSVVCGFVTLDLI